MEEAELISNSDRRKLYSWLVIFGLDDIQMWRADTFNARIGLTLLALSSCLEVTLSSVGANPDAAFTFRDPNFGTRIFRY